jgi:hypothetical protein
MNTQRAKYLDELQLLAPVREITESYEWTVFWKKNNISSDDSFIDCMHLTLSALKEGNYKDAKFRALMGLIYLTGRIVDTSKYLKSNILGISFERDISISLKLPGEGINGLSFAWGKSHFQKEPVGIFSSNYAALINKGLVKCSECSSLGGEGAQAIYLISLSYLYSALVNLVINAPASNNTIKIGVKDD